jgi:hypothetical protein
VRKKEQQREKEGTAKRLGTLVTRYLNQEVTNGSLDARRARIYDRAAFLLNRLTLARRLALSGVSDRYLRPTPATAG